jgi:hypothetical protein
MLDVLRRHFASCRPRLARLETVHNAYANLDRLDPQHPIPISVDAFIDSLGRAPRMTIKTHGLPSFEAVGRPDLVAELFEGARVIHVVRDGRSVMTSWRHYDWERSEAARESFGAFIRSPAAGFPDRVTSWAEHARAWEAVDGALLVRFEDLMQEPRRVVERIAAYLGETAEDRDPLPPRVGGRVSSWVKRLLGKRDSSTLPGPATGERQRWREAFANQADRSFFEDRGGEVLRRHGYENDAAWVERDPSA